MFVVETQTSAPAWPVLISTGLGLSPELRQSIDSVINNNKVDKTF
jgi:hypothetical protein